MSAGQAIEPLIRLKKVLVPIDFSMPSRQALEYARGFAHCFGGEIILLHAAQPAAAYFPEAAVVAAPEGEELADAELNLRLLARESLAGDSSRVMTMVRCGLPAHVIVETARELDADLIVIATHGYTGWKHFCIGSTTERVVRTASCPVFVIREKEHELI